MHFTHAYDRTAAARDFRQPATIRRDLERQQCTARHDPVCRCARTATARSSSSARLICVLQTDSATSGAVATPECRRRYRDRAYTACGARRVRHALFCGCTASPAVTIRKAVVGAHASIIRAASAIARTAAAPPAETGRSAAESHAILDYRGIDHVGWDTSYRTGAARACAGAACARSTRSTSAASHEHMRIANGNSKNSAVQLHTPRSPSLSTALKPLHARHAPPDRKRGAQWRSHSRGGTC